MTITDKRATIDTRRGIAAGLVAARAKAGRRAKRPSLISATVTTPIPDPIDLFVAARSLGYEATLWIQPDAERALVGVGRAWTIDATGDDRFEVAAAAWRALLASAVASGSPADVPEAGPILLGGLGFTGHFPSEDDTWAPFGAASLVLPVFSAVRRGSWSGVTVSAGPGGIDGLDATAMEQHWDALVGAATTAAAGGRARGSASGQPSVADHDELVIVGERPDRAGWDRTVGLFAGAVGRGRIDKVVLARRVALAAGAELDIEAALRHLVRTAPESTTFAFGRGNTTFLGATPERLVRTAGRSFETVAIAGSAARGETAEGDARQAAGLLASEKDREEHAVVVDMLRTSLRPIADSLAIADTPSVLLLRHVQHLVTPVRGTLREDAGLLDVAGRLHPTPAVGGAPRDIALALIEEHETFDRGWYAGPIGWLGADGDGEMMVALRCGLVNGSQATLFAGCGIVADSDPAREWDESRLKLRTMTAALGADPAGAK